MTRRNDNASVGLSVLDEIAAAKAKRGERKAGAAPAGDGRADADLVKRLKDNIFAFYSKDGGLVVDLITTYPMKGRKPKCRIGIGQRDDFLAALAVVLADEDFLKAKADKFAAEQK